MNEKNSIRGRTARKVVRIVHQLPYFGHLAQNGELQRRLIAREKKWQCPAHLEQKVIPVMQGWPKRDFGKGKEHEPGNDLDWVAEPQEKAL